MTAPTAGAPPYVPRHLATRRRAKRAVPPAGLTTSPANLGRTPQPPLPPTPAAARPQTQRTAEPAQPAQATAARRQAGQSAATASRFGRTTQPPLPAQTAQRAAARPQTGRTARPAPAAVGDGVWWRALAARLTPGPHAGARRLLVPVTVGFGLAALSGCAERRLVAAPETPPATSTWTAVWLAGVLAALVLGVLLTLPAWRQRGGAAFAVVLLTAQAGTVAVTGAILSCVALRSWQLIEHPLDSAPAVALLRLSRADGDTGFFALMVLLVVVVSALLVTLLSLSAQFARGHDPVERTVACGVLAVQLGGCAYAAARLVLGAEGWAYTGATALLPLVVIAFATCWPALDEEPAASTPLATAR